jgi:hypothetical protein
MTQGSSIITEIIPGKLWHGDLYALRADWMLMKLGNVVQVASIMHYSPDVPDRYHHIYLEAEDESKLDPAIIHEFCSAIISMPTYLHCYSGFNRSTAMACCSLILHNFEVPLSILNVLVKRNSDLARAHDGSATRMSWQMMDNVARYIDWLKEEKGLEL